MKKLFSILLCTVLVLSMSVTAFAAESPATNNGGDTTIDVTGTFVGSSGAGEVISVDVSWDAMNFTYTEGAKGEWLPGEHKYAEDAAGSWSSDTATITVKNHSNVAVSAALGFTASVDGVVGTFTDSDGASVSKLTLANAAEGESLNNVDKAPTATAEFGISGAAIAESKTLGTITVSISAVSERKGITVSTLAELQEAIADNVKVTMTNEVVDTDFSLTIPDNVDVIIDLYGSEIGSLNIGDDSTVTFVDTNPNVWSVIDNSIAIGESTLVLEGVIISYGAHVTIANSSAYLNFVEVATYGFDITATVEGWSTNNLSATWSALSGFGIYESESPDTTSEMYEGVLTKDQTYYYREVIEYPDTM